MRLLSFGAFPSLLLHLRPRRHPPRLPTGHPLLMPLHHLRLLGLRRHLHLHHRLVRDLAVLVAEHRLCK